MVQGQGSPRVNYSTAPVRSPGDHGRTLSLHLDSDVFLYPNRYPPRFTSILFPTDRNLGSQHASVTRRPGPIDGLGYGWKSWPNRNPNPASSPVLNAKPLDLTTKPTPERTLEQNPTPGQN